MKFTENGLNYKNRINGGGDLVIFDAYPSKAQYNKGETIEILVDVYGMEELDQLECSIYHFHNKIQSLKEYEIISPNQLVFRFDMTYNNKEMAGYGVDIEVCFKDGQRQIYHTAFDILDSWSSAPRYGFLSDFSPEDRGMNGDLTQMNKYHLNVVQFYDWMYRHDQLIPDTEEFIDPLHRKLSLGVVKEKISEARKLGMHTMGYGAVYGASPEYYERHPEQAIYKNNDSAFAFENFLCMMDISPENEWHDHIIKEFYQMIQLGFDGIHLDQYGFPKEAVSIRKDQKTIRILKEDFPVLINDTKAYIRQRGGAVSLIFNAVNNWPIETVAPSEVDAVYIEVWPPNDTYQDLYHLITNAKKLAPDKQVILAAYIKPFLAELNVPQNEAENAAMLAMATIFASGGFHLVLGEDNAILTDPYYPKYRSLQNEVFLQRLRSYQDFIVKYEELLFDLDIQDTTMVSTGGINEDCRILELPASPKAEADSIWTVVKEKPGYKIISLVNFTGIHDMNWNEKKPAEPKPVSHIEVQVLTCQSISGIYAASPDVKGGAAVKLDYDYVDSSQGKKLRFYVPELRLWSLIYLVY